jgi:hypothetical protein
MLSEETVMNVMEIMKVFAQVQMDHKVREQEWLVDLDN